MRIKINGIEFWAKLSFDPKKDGIGLHTRDISPEKAKELQEWLEKKNKLYAIDPNDKRMMAAIKLIKELK